MDEDREKIYSSKSDTQKVPPETSSNSYEKVKNVARANNEVKTLLLNVGYGNGIYIALLKGVLLPDQARYLIEQN